LGFALIWRIYWLAGLGLVGAVVVPLIESWKSDLVRVPAEEVTVFEQSHGPGVDPTEQHGVSTYRIGLGFAVALTIALFWAAPTSLVYAPAVPMLLAALAIAQMGVHVAFFLHISRAPDQANNFLALAFGVFVTGLIVCGSIMIMAHHNHNMMPMDEL
jgi:cytochrome o ubiquinol oxidase operon protein cyoD